MRYFNGTLAATNCKAHTTAQHSGAQPDIRLQVIIVGALNCLHDAALPACLADVKLFTFK